VCGWVPTLSFLSPLLSAPSTEMDYGILNWKKEATTSFIVELLVRKMSRGYGLVSHDYVRRCRQLLYDEGKFIV
jgi:hypothetical protein